MPNRVLYNATVATCLPGSKPYGLIHQGAVAIEDGMISWCGAYDTLPEKFSALPKHDCKGGLLTPSFIDCHTHIVHGGHRAAEFEQRLQGASYAEISASGGGIVSTMTATRAASVDSLIESALPRVDSLLGEGVSVIEIKSGYGLDIDTELNMLRAARKIQTLRPVTVKTSFLGAHALPTGYNGSKDSYIDDVCIAALEQAHRENLVDAVDGFCESIAFTTDQIERVFIKAHALGLPVKLHAEQLTLSDGAALAARYNALSADHLEYLDEDGVRAMAKSGTVAVLLPGAFYTLRETQHPPVALFRKHAVAIAIATDSNPGSSPLTSLLLTMNMACTLFTLTPEEALAGVTRCAALALGMTDRGTLGPGMIADVCLWNVSHPSELCYRIGFNPLIERFPAGDNV